MKLKLLCLPLLLTILALGASGQATTTATGDRVVTFKFQPGQDMFYIPYGGNDEELNRLYSLVDEYRTEITNGTIPIHVDGYCASGETPEAGFKIAVTRSNRVKSEVITHKGLSEEHFVTNNHTTAFRDAEGRAHRDMVVVTLRIPAKTELRDDTAEQERLAREREAAERARLEQQQREKAERERIERERARAEAECAAREQAERDALLSQTEPAAPTKPYCFAVRTNLLYDAFLVPNLGLEWRVNRHVGVQVNYGGSYWGDSHGKVQKIWLLNPEVRWYLLDAKRFYVGAAANFGEYNIYKGMIGSMFPDNKGYQGKLWNAGLTVGYQLYLNRSFSLDFNLGLGYTKFEYDSFTVTNETRVYLEKDKSKNFWGPTQAGVSLVWTIGGKK